MGVTVNLFVARNRNLFYVQVKIIAAYETKGRHLNVVFKKENEHGRGCQQFSSFMYSFSSTVGTGNIVGVATAIAAGGPGALFWMWISAFFGMATKYAEGLLAIRYRVKDENGQMAGGPMYYLERGLRSPFLAKLFAFFGVAVALLGIGTFTQVKSISDAMS